MKARYVNPYTDFGFKKLFGQEASKDLLKDFLNELLPPHHRIKTLQLQNAEALGDGVPDRRAIFDIRCEGDNGDKFIVEMQKSKFDFFKDRSVYYSTFPIREQAEKGTWDFNLNPVYCVGILDFVFDSHGKGKQEEDNPYFNHVQLRDQYCRTFFDKLTYIFIEMPLFNKTETELATHFDKWLYFLKHLEDFNDIPAVLNEPIFQKGFQILEVANFTQAQADAYEDSLKVYRDLHGVIRTAKKDARQEGRELGREEGREERNWEIAAELLESGVSIEVISKSTGLSQAEIERLQS